MSGNSIVCLTETQKKLRDVNFEDDCVVIDSMREQQDRKGGGLMMLCRKNKGVVMQKIDTKSKDVLHVKGNIEGWEVRILLVYLSVNDEVRNNKIKEEVERIMEGNSDPLIVTGDFNGRVGFKGEQRVNKNGEMILEWMEKYRLIMLNEDEKCIGEITWSRNE